MFRACQELHCAPTELVNLTTFAVYKHFAALRLGNAHNYSSSNSACCPGSGRALGRFSTCKL